MGKHALLSASSSHRWLNCPPSARLCEGYDDKGSDFAAEGTDAHSLCEYKLRKALGMEAEDPTENLTYYNGEMEECANGFAAFALELVEQAKQNCPDPIVLIEQKLDYSKYVESGFGTGDCVIVADDLLRNTFHMDLSGKKGVNANRIIIAVLGIGSMLLALDPPELIFTLIMFSIAIVMPLALNVGMDPVLIMSFISACYGYFFLPTYPSDLACIGFDRSGTTRIGKYILNHSFMIPGLIGVFTGCCAGFVMAHIVL